MDNAVQSNLQINSVIYFFDKLVCFSNLQIYNCLKLFNILLFYICEYLSLADCSIEVSRLGLRRTCKMSLSHPLFTSYFTFAPNQKGLFVCCLTEHQQYLGN